MRTLYFLVPGTGGRFACGGLFVELKTAELAKHLCPAEVVTYQQREANTLFLDDVLKRSDLENSIFVISWGFHVPKLARRLKGHPVIYHAHSGGYGFKLPADIPIITVSRNTMGYWGQVSPTSLIYYLPNPISDRFTNRHLERDIDVLVQVRKSSEYLLNDLVPALKQTCKVVVLDSFVEDLSELFNRAKVYLYDSAEYWAQQRVSEGFGLPPLEAMACGCQVFSSVNSALADYLDPGFNCQKISCYSREWDLARILKALRTPAYPSLSEEDLKPYSQETTLRRFAVILAELNEFFDQKPKYTRAIPGLTSSRMTRLFFKRVSTKLAQKLKR